MYLQNKIVYFEMGNSELVLGSSEISILIPIQKSSFCGFVHFQVKITTKKFWSQDVCF